MDREQEHIRRIVTTATQSIDEALQERKKRRAAPPKQQVKHKPLSDVAQLERQIYLTNLTLNQFEVKLEDGDDLNPEEMRVFMSLNDSLRKLTLSLSALRDKEDLGKLDGKTMVAEMLQAGMTRDKALLLYPELEHHIDRVLEDMKR